MKRWAEVGTASETPWPRGGVLTGMWGGGQEDRLVPPGGYHCATIQSSGPKVPGVVSQNPEAFGTSSQAEGGILLTNAREFHAVGGG